MGQDLLYFYFLFGGLGVRGGFRFLALHWILPFLLCFGGGWRMALILVDAISGFPMRDGWMEFSSDEGYGWVGAVRRNS